MSISLREATPADKAFLIDVYASTRAEELALVAWSQDQRQAFVKFQFDAQHSYYHEQFPQANFQVILNQGEPVGRLYVLRQEDWIKILDIAVLPHYRGQGIGTTLVQELLAEAADTGKGVQIWIERLNTSLSLFQRLGFSEIKEDGFNCLLECRPSK
jgi:ribosomal protein S18 acetylase RimI-like enzyme